MANLSALTALAVSALVCACGGPTEPPREPASETAPIATTASATPETPPAPPETAASAAPEAPSPSAPVEPAPTPPAAGTAEVTDVQVTGGAIENATSVIDGMRAGFRSCYAKGLKEKADAQGDVTLTIRVGAAGQVLGVAAQRTTLVPQTVVSCITGRGGAASFAPPTGTKKKVDVTVGMKITLKPS